MLIVYTYMACRRRHMRYSYMKHLPMNVININYRDKKSYYYSIILRHICRFDKLINVILSYTKFQHYSN